MKSLRTFNLVFTIVILVLGIVMYLHYQHYQPEVKTKEDVTKLVKEIDRYKDIKQIKERYINHVQKNFENHRIVDTLVEYVIYLFAGIVIFLLVTVFAVYKMDQRR